MTAAARFRHLGYKELDRVEGSVARHRCCQEFTCWILNTETCGASHAVSTGTCESPAVVVILTKEQSAVVVVFLGPSLLMHTCAGDVGM